jgi:hypothetical protein
MLLHDAIFCACVLGVGSTFLFRWLAAPAGLMLVAGVIAALSPAHAHLAFSIASGAAFVFVTILGSVR